MTNTPHQEDSMTTQLEVFEKLPKSEKTLLRWWRKGTLPIALDNSIFSTEYTFTLPNGSTEYTFTLPNGERGMVKYYRGRKLACYELVTT